MRADPPAQGDEPGFGRSGGAPVLFNLVYCSRAAAGVDTAAVGRIVATARKYNPQSGITGMLVFGGGIFFQWLEGPRDNVLALMTRLQADPRHKDVVTLSTVEEVRERLFPDWDMELVTSEHIRDVLADAHASATDPKQAAALAGLLADLDGAALSGLKA
jgi:cation diffusion facilitator CzcD-associated flavoprotein CzcO